MSKLIVVGNACVEVHVPPHEPPPPGGSAEVQSIAFRVGGKGVNTAITAARLGATTAYAGVLGGDLAGELVRDTLRGEGVDVSRLRLLPGRTSPTQVVQMNSRREASIVRAAGTNDDFELESAVLRAPCSLFHISAPELLGGIWPRKAIDLVRQLKVAGRRVSVDVFAEGSGGPRAVERNVREHRHLMELIEMVFLSEEEAALISGRKEKDSAMRYFHERGIGTVVIKCGAKGAIVSVNGWTEEIPAAKSRVVDPAGAGDNFVGGFLAGHIRGLDPVQCGRLGCTLGALCVRHVGPLAGTSDPQRLEKILANLEVALSR